MIAWPLSRRVTKRMQPAMTMMSTPRREVGVEGMFIDLINLCTFLESV